MTRLKPGYVDVSICNNSYQWSSFSIHESQLSFLRDVVSNFIAKREPITAAFSDYEPSKHNFSTLINKEKQDAAPSRKRTSIVRRA